MTGSKLYGSSYHSNEYAIEIIIPNEFIAWQIHSRAPSTRLSGARVVESMSVLSQNDIIS